MTNTLKTGIESLVQTILPTVESWFAKGRDGLDRLMDPVDDVEISAHYGATHAAAALIIWGRSNDDGQLYGKGASLLRSILDRWHINRKLPAFHADFNNFALALIRDYVDDDLKEIIKQTVLSTPDSPHNTVNWLPMRWVVNLKRFEWTHNKRYSSKADACKRIIAAATNRDGGVEDRLPAGTSFNTQYDLATVAVLQYLRTQGVKLDLSKELGFLLQIVSPDGDVNYLGRGTNQVFAWGMWIYLLASAGCDRESETAISYLSERIPVMLQNRSMMLNEWDGAEKYLWWDYHYASVYTSHCLLWLVLAWRDCGRSAIVPTMPASAETGVHIVRTDNCFVSWFEGRNEYLAERGPAVAAIWMKKTGLICKGAFGPWQGAFGNNYLFDDPVIKNYCGLIEVRRNRDWSKNKYLSRLLPFSTSSSVSFKPLFCPVDATIEKSRIIITWTGIPDTDVVVNIPTYTKKAHLELKADDRDVALHHVGMFRNQYAWVCLFQSRMIHGRKICLIIS